MAQPQPEALPTIPLFKGASCDICPLGGRAQPVESRIPDRVSLVILDNSPLVSGREFRPWREISKALGAARYGETAQLFVTACPSNKLKKDEWRAAAECCRPRLEAELAEARAKLAPEATPTILGAGNRAFEVLSGKPRVEPEMGSIEQQPLPAFAGYRILGTIHPNQIFNEPPLQEILRVHVERAFLLSRSALPLWKWPAFNSNYDGSEESAAATLAALLRIEARKKLCCIDVETRPENKAKRPKGAHPHRDILRAVGISDENDMVSVLVEQLPQPWQETELGQALKRITEAEDHPKGMQNGMFDAACLAAHGIILQGYAFEAMALWHHAFPGLKKNLALMACVATWGPRWKGDFHKDWETADLGALALYNARDCYATLAVIAYANRRLAMSPIPGWEARRSMLHSQVLAATEMYWHGISLDLEERGRLRRALVERKRQLTRELQQKTKAAGLQIFKHTKISAYKQLFFEILGVEPVKFTKKKAISLNGEALSILARANNEEALARREPVAVAADLALTLHACRRVTKMIENLDGMIIERDTFDDRPLLFPSPNPWGAKTGRWSYRGYNMQNVTKGKSKKGANGETIVLLPSLRGMFKARSAQHIIVTADWVQLELKLIALYAGVRKLLEAYALEKDVHTENTIALFKITDVEAAKADKETWNNRRTLAKNFVYNANYGGSLETITALLQKDFPTVTLAMVRMLMTAWMKANPEIPAFQRQQLREAQQTGYSVEVFSTNHTKHLGDKVDGPKAINWPIQTCASYLVQRALARLRARWAGTAVRVWLQVHDEIGLEGPKELELEMALSLREEMDVFLELDGARVRTTVDVSSGSSWGNQKHVALPPWVPETTLLPQLPRFSA